jgi:hypothetical protein
VARYLLEPVVLPDFGPAACLESGLPVALEDFSPESASRAVPEIREALPARLAQPSETLAVFLAESIQAGEYALPYLVLEVGSQITANGQAFTSQRPLLLLARQGRKARSLAALLLERERVFLDPLQGTMDPLLAAVWLVRQAANLSCGESSSLGRLYQSAQSLSMTTMAEIEAVRGRKTDPAVDQALVNALQALSDRRQKLQARLEKEILDENRKMETSILRGRTESQYLNLGLRLQAALSGLF